MPKVGGTTVYLNEAYHPMVGFMSGMSSAYLLDWSIAGLSIALIASFRTFTTI